MESSELPDPPDWELLSSLFADDGAYRHRMGLRRADGREFYAGTPAGDAILREKRTILERDGDRYTLVTPAGHRAADEFASILGLAEAEDNEEARAYNRRLSLALEPDLLFVQPPAWSLAWASVCFPSRWSLEGKLRHPLTGIHEAVPGLNPELGNKISTFFARLTPGEGWRRANWGLSASPCRNQHPTEAVPALTAGLDPSGVYVRIEDQHLLKLPKTGAIAFGIRIKSFAWTEVRQNDAISSSLLAKLRSMPPETSRYKGLAEIIPQMLEKR